MYRIFVHIRNAIKYALLLLSAEASFSHSTLFWAISATISTSYAIFWDLHEDWGLFEFTGRRIRIVPPNRLFKPYAYIIGIIENTILRFTWIFKLIKSSMPKYLFDTLIDGCEIIRRIWWNVFRLENEQINNCGLFRATKAIPLPFTVDEVEEPLCLSEEKTNVYISPSDIELEKGDERSSRKSNYQVKQRRSTLATFRARQSSAYNHIDDSNVDIKV